MGFTDLFKKKRELETIGNKKIEVPAAPPSKKDMPEFPTPKEIPEFRKEGAKIERPQPKKSASSIERIERKAVTSQKKELEERDDLKLKKPIFVYLDSYKEIMKEVNQINNTLKEGDDSLKRVAEFKEDEDEEFSRWESQIKDIQKKLIYADKTLFAAQK
ncbi:hypothetical protein GF361_01665 [Candidatus Woesearchaeota archaeon]|nr:hypothetical protein [Candidatus Woesearchaeota archaeon]